MGAVPLPVSVQVCTLNEEDNIGACLAGIVANNPEEIVVIDGGSRDRTVEIARDSGARVLSPGRLGLGPSRRLGYMSATAPYVAFVDADDRLPRTWLRTMLTELEAGGYAALQSCLRVEQPTSFWARGWNRYFVESVRPMADTTMVGRPALLRTADLQADATEFASLDEDTHMSRSFELRGLRQGIGTAVAYRLVEETFEENWRKWQSYGRGYAGFVDEHPERRRAIMKHMLITIPVVRAWRPVAHGQLLQPAFGALMGAAIVSGFTKARLASNRRP